MGKKKSTCFSNGARFMECYFILQNPDFNYLYGSKKGPVAQLNRAIAF